VTIGAAAFDENVAEQALLDWLRELGYTALYGPELVPSERADHRDVLLEGRLRAALARLNRGAPTTALDEAVRRARRVESPSLLVRNRRFHELLVDVEALRVLLEKVDVIESRALDDPETGGSYTVKLYERVSSELVRLQPDSEDEGFEPIELRDSDGDVRVVAELVEVLPG
jgi:hypothetical protein